jgi:hypothetical protein
MLDCEFLEPFDCVGLLSKLNLRKRCARIHISYYAHLLVPLNAALINAECIEPLEKSQQVTHPRQILGPAKTMAILAGFIGHGSKHLQYGWQLLHLECGSYFGPSLYKGWPCPSHSLHALSQRKRYYTLAFRGSRPLPFPLSLDRTF